MDSYRPPKRLRSNAGSYDRGSMPPPAPPSNAPTGPKFSHHALRSHFPYSPRQAPVPPTPTQGTAGTKRLKAMGCQTYRKEEFKIGKIIRAPFHEQDYNPPGITNTNDLTESNWGPVHSKFRPMIVVALYRDHYIVVPLFTHQSRGISNPRYQKDDWISVKDHRTTECEQQSSHAPLTTSTLERDVPIFHPKSAAHVTAPASRSYTALCKMQGQLTQNSIFRLLDLYVERAPKPPENPQN